ncbi:hypothetical protein PSACC_03508 [Paramicrosporidium saccamoebae]|uniref:Uncharacterized protein n=1 Tax=Paramicrosporidium saccamoebae TaxID=1246581 RepID=A0A2H9TFW9_9FUNG|nr:hypothetical protein PSACC_03508 [Paramicrosporidium saccamoebae]
MRIHDRIQYLAFAAPHPFYMYLLGQAHPVEGLAPGAIMMLFIVPFFALLAVLKYRAAYHRKVSKRQKGEGDIGSGYSFNVYLRELFLWEAKATPVYSPVLSAVWDLLCSLVIWLLFPPRFAAAYIMFAWLHGIPQVAITGRSWESFIGTDSVVYNCRRYKLIRGGAYQFRLEDENQNILFYPAADFRALVPQGNE